METKKEHYLNLMKLYGVYCDIFDEIYKLKTSDKEEIEKLYNNVKNNLINTKICTPDRIINAITQAACINHRYMNSYLDLAHLIIEEFHQDNKDLLYYKDQLEAIFQEKPILKVIMNDDKCTFISLIESEDFHDEIFMVPSVYPAYYESILTYLDVCCFYGSVHCFKLLRTKYNSQIRIESLELAFLGGNPDIISECLKVIRPNRHCMVNAIMSHNIDFVTYLRNEFEIEIRISICAYYKNLRAFLVYLDQTNDINTCFIYSPLFQIQSLCEYLLSQGVDFRSKDEARSALLNALGSNRLELVNLLISLGIDINAKNTFGETPFLFAVGHSSIDIIKLLIAHGVDINAKNEFDFYPIHAAVRRQSTEIVELLILHGANINVKNRPDFYPIHEAVLMDNKDMVRLLISHGADVNQKNDKGITPVYFAIMKDNKEMTELLISNGADINIKNNNGKTALDSICDYGHHKIKDFLLSKGAVHSERWLELHQPLRKCLLI
ncbi:ankyrin repeat protein, putative [Trichomonas vaginalis G3]|uniref:Ankyrin repeat protein, putative n=1 Tax=Trichomonas vaginalis (strain ATCC PRA-98 / G3) TaxID=412133 RepID=A2FHB9_TRIV3|nr:protein ubiquitination [Trichomonas vaginalis G3]EAX95716.1 ankyrin repeat protein, putative [Trichomonas vaginalis G3]KAI5491209.1 protein ubiquitination [Trichomonas vaginalis G3]|eukprot:XP_001308646.1 ankyrin repeat protein [Trichomonas vaginalis G3]